jgi:hypothetical protein
LKAILKLLSESMFGPRKSIIAVEAIERVEVHGSNSPLARDSCLSLRTRACVAETVSLLPIYPG